MPTCQTIEICFLDKCSQKRDAGICPGNVPRFYFDKKLGSCRLFTYGGCGGNSNNFASLDDCVANCGGPAKHAGIGAGSSKKGKFYVLVGYIFKFLCYCLK